MLANNIGKPPDRQDSLTRRHRQLIPQRLDSCMQQACSIQHALEPLNIVITPNYSLGSIIHIVA